MSATFTIAVIGLGEAGSTIVHDLINPDVQVQGWDPAPRRDVSQIPLATMLDALEISKVFLGRRGSLYGSH